MTVLGRALKGGICVVCCNVLGNGAVVGSAGGPVAAGGSGGPTRVPSQGGTVSRQVRSHGELTMFKKIF